MGIDPVFQKRALFAHLTASCWFWVLFVCFSSQRTLASADVHETFINICKVDEFVNNGY